MAIGRQWIGRLAGLLALVVATLGAATASAPVADGWTADPDEQFVLDVNLRRLKLGDGVRAYSTPSGPCIVFGDFLAALDVPMKVDLEAHRASGWAFKPENQLLIDKAASVVTIKGKRESFAFTDVRDVPEGWCVATGALERWFGLGLKARTGIALLQVESEAKLPVELAAERRMRAASLKRKASLDLSTLPQVRVPYRLWRSPALEFVVNAGVTYSAGSGLVVDRSATMAAAGEVGGMSYLFQVTSSAKRAIDQVHALLYRSDPDGGLLGPLHATHVAAGDVEGLQSAFGGGGGVGRGAMITNQPLSVQSAFDKTSFTGELPPGWDAELYRNDSLVAFADGQSGDKRYHFDDVDLLYGENRFDIVLYGPQGQVQHRSETLNVGQDNVPPGKLWYWAGARQPNTPVLALGGAGADPPAGAPLDVRTPTRAPEAAAQIRYGVSQRLSVAALVRSLAVEDQRVTYVEGSVRYSLGRALVELAGAYDNKGGTAARAQVATKIGAVAINASSLITNHFAASTDRKGEAIKAEHSLAVAVPVRLGEVRLPVSGDVRLIDRVSGAREVDAAARLSARLGRFNLAGETRLRRQLGETDGQPRDQWTAGLLASGRVGRVRLRAAADWEVRPQQRFTRAEIDAYWSAGENLDFEAGVSYAPEDKLVRGRLSYIRRFNTMALAVTGEAASDGSVAAGINLNFAIDPFHGSWRPTRDKLATTGAVHARVFEDLNENGRRDEGEPVTPAAFVTTGTKLADRETGKDGTVAIGGLAPYVPVAVGIDQSSLANPSLAPAKPVQVVVPRPGVAATVDIALVGGGSIEGIVVKEDGSAFEGVGLELLGDDGQVIGTAISDIDGYFLFDAVRYGTYRVRLGQATATALGVPRELPATITLDRDHPLGRTGNLRVVRPPAIAQSAAPPGATSGRESSGTTLR